MALVALPLAQVHGAQLSLERDTVLERITAVVIDCRGVDRAVRVSLYRADETLIRSAVFLPGAIRRRDLTELEKPPFLRAMQTHFGKPTPMMVSPKFRLEAA